MQKGTRYEIDPVSEGFFEQRAEVDEAFERSLAVLERVEEVDVALRRLVAAGERAEEAKFFEAAPAKGRFDGSDACFKLGLVHVSL